MVCIDRWGAYVVKHFARLSEGVGCIDLKGNNPNNCMVWMQVSSWRLHWAEDVRDLLSLLERRIFWRRIFYYRYHEVALDYC